MCLDDDQILLLIEGRLSAAARTLAEAHLDGCEACRRLVGAAAGPTYDRPGADTVASLTGSAAPGRLAATTEASAVTGAAPAPPAATGILPRGSAVGRYLVLALIGKGGMGRVYSAYDPELDRRVAIKLLHTARGSEGARRFLAREARALGKLSHANVVQVYDVGEHHGDVFVAMELVEGQSLEAWCRRSPKPGWREVLAVYLDAARGLSAAHAKGLVHRDVKPANILCGNDGRVFVADFGLAAGREAADRTSGSPEPSGPAEQHFEPSPLGETVPAPAGASGSIDERLTRTGALLGTPLYMAPEQHGGARATAASDQYSFCLALHEGLYGALPFERNRCSSMTEMLEQMGSAKGAGPPAAPPAGTPVPAWIYKALARGLAADPAGRYPSMDALAAALRDDPDARRRVSWRRAGIGVATAALLAVAVAGWAKSGAFHDPCEHPERQLAGAWDEGVRGRVRAAFLGSGRSYAEGTATRVGTILDRYAGSWARMRGEVCVAARGDARPGEVHALRDACLERRRDQLQALTTLFAEKPDPQVLDRAVSAAAGLYPVAYCADTEALTARVRPPEDPAVRARVAELQPRVDRIEALYRAGKYKDGVALGDPLLVETEALPYAPLRAQIRYRMGQLREGTGDYAKAAALLREAAGAAAEGRDDAMVANAWAMLLFVVGERQQHLDEAAVIEALGPSVMARTQDEVARANWMSSAGLVLQHLGKLAEAKDMLERSLALRDRVEDPDHPDTSATLNNLANVLYEMADYPRALATYRRALGIEERVRGPDHPAVAWALYNLANVLDVTGDYALAASTHERALAIKEKALGPDHPAVASSLANLGQVLLHEGDYERALAAYERALAIKEKALGPDNPSVAYALSGVGRAEVRLGKLDAALPVLERARRLMESAQGTTRRDAAEPLLGLGELYLARQAPREAVPVLEGALALENAALAPEIELTLAEALWGIDQDRPRARALAESARARYERIGHRLGIDRATRWLADHALASTGAPG